MREGKARILDDTEFKRLLRVTSVERHSRRNKCIILLLWGCGMRIGEVAKIRIGDIYGEDGKIRKQFHVRKADSKTKVNREIFLSNPKLRQAVRDYIKYRTENEGPNLNPVAYLFKSQKGSGFSANTMQQLVKRLCIEAGLPPEVSSHSGRRTFATKLIADGVDIKSVAKLLGHASIRQTCCYAEANPVLLEKIAARTI